MAGRCQGDLRGGACVCVCPRGEVVEESVATLEGPGMYVCDDGGALGLDNVYMLMA